jgi:hypothetical protein
MSNPTWQDDLFGGRDKVYIDKDANEVRISQTSEDRIENDSRGKGDYPHWTGNYNGDSSWHYSDNSKTHGDAVSYNEETDYEDIYKEVEVNNSQDLFQLDLDSLKDDDCKDNYSNTEEDFSKNESDN